MMLTYSEMSKFETFEERFRYLRLGCVVGEQTFGFDRCVNQNFYSSSKWRSIRSKVIIRDDGCDLGVAGYDILDKIFIHHINPVSLDLLEEDSPMLYDMDNLVCVSFDTHQAIHFGNLDKTLNTMIERHPRDTILW